MDAGADFSHEAFQLGRATAALHATLAERLPTQQPTPETISAITAMWTARLEAAIRDVPSLVEHKDDIQTAYAAAASSDWPRLQRIHGDLHLGQVLAVPHGGWRIVDFEGEPLRPMAERAIPDLPPRDVAGMLRSFDYAPQAVARALPDADAAAAEQRAYRAEEWSSRNRTAFLEAYAGRVLTHDEGALLAAYLADKALYECVYETRNRPAWLEIPLEAIRRMAS